MARGRDTLPPISSDDDLRIRAATVEDAAAIAKVHIESSEDSYKPLVATWPPPNLLDREQKWRASLSQEVDSSEATTIVALLCQEVVGFVGAGPARKAVEDAERWVFACFDRGAGTRALTRWYRIAQFGGLLAPAYPSRLGLRRRDPCLGVGAGELGIV
jgi:hypothetical protein